MTPSFSFTVYEKPRHCPRPWVFRGICVNTAQKKQKETLKKIFVQGLPEAPLFPKEVALEATFTFCFKIPVSWSKKKAQAHREQPHIGAPDLDNLIKFYLDAINGVVYPDDRQIASLKAIKKWAPQDRVEGILAVL